MMNGKFVILHLSDAHLGNPKYLVDSLNLFDLLWKDLETFYKTDRIKPNLIVFSGDLVFGNIVEKKIKEQYIEAEEFLKKLYSCFETDYGGIPILIVPGNHDIDRSSIDEAQRNYRDTYSDELVKDLMFKKDITWKRIIERQKEWFAFYKIIPDQPWDVNPDLHFTTGTISHSGKRVGVVGLNSSWASHEEMEQGKLWIGEFQYNEAYQRIKDTDFKIAVSHHPTDWLHVLEKNNIGQKLETQFDVFLHGHEHTQWFTDSVNHLKCAAGTCYNGTKKQNGYSWILIDFQEINANIILRTYTDQGKGGWIGNHIPGKTDEKGVGQLAFFKAGEKDQQSVDQPLFRKESKPILSTTGTSKFPDNIEDYLSVLQDRFYFRWERGNTGIANKCPLIYWPVRLRQPTPIHAAQCFVAAGLHKIGCEISLWIDDLGSQDYSVELFTQKLKDWFKRAGADESHIEIRRFSEILLNDGQQKPAWTMLQNWLGTMVYYTDHILKISKIWPAEISTKDSPQDILNEFKKRRPRRLMTPSMVWTCLLVLSQKDTSLSIITLGGYDEKELWDAWRTCCDIPDVRVGHLYVPKLTQRKNEIEQPVHMSENRLAWQSKEDIEVEFRKSLSEDDSLQTWSNIQRMIPWTMNNCVLLPNFVNPEHHTLTIKGHLIDKLDDLKINAPSDIFEDLVGAVNKWLL